VAKRDWFTLVLLALVPAGGCTAFPEPARTTSWLRRQHLLPPEIENQIVQLELPLLERPLGDPFLNQELWQYTDEMIVDLDHKAAIEDNGYRVGKIVGMTPGKLHDLLRSERSCSNPQRRIFPSGHNVLQYLSAVQPHCDFAVQLGKQVREESFDQARFCLDIKATLTNDGKTRLTFTPKVENGEQTFPFQPDPDKQTWTMRFEKPCQSYPELSWDAVLAPGEYLVIGAAAGKVNSLGYRSFVQEDGNPVQRLLVLRTNRAIGGDDSAAASREELARSERSPCLAVRAGMTKD
jgi:hypothetical protein